MSKQLIKDEKEKINRAYKGLRESKEFESKEDTYFYGYNIQFRQTYYVLSVRDYKKKDRDVCESGRMFHLLKKWEAITAEQLNLLDRKMKALKLTYPVKVISKGKLIC